MPTLEIERRIVFTPSEVLNALKGIYPDIPADVFVQVKIGSANHPLDGVFDEGATPLISLTRNLESLALLSYDKD